MALELGRIPKRDHSRVVLLAGEPTPGGLSERPSALRL